MDHEDIRRSIYLNVDRDIKNLINISSVDKLSQKICSKTDFWEPIFKEYGLQFSEIKYDNIQIWISTYEKERKSNIYTNRLMEILEHPKLEDFEDIDEDDDVDIGLFVYIDQCP